MTSGAVDKAAEDEEAEGAEDAEGAEAVKTDDG
jgi:hypothetical protein